MKNRKGFTLTEVMVTVLIIASLAAIAYPMYNRSIMKARVADAISLIEIVRTAQQRNMAVNGNYFTQFTNAQVTGDTRIVKASGLSVKDGVLKKGLYEVSIKGPKDTDQYHANSCIEIKYYIEENGDVLFTIQGLVEDSVMYCQESDSKNGICDMVIDGTSSALCK